MRLKPYKIIGLIPATEMGYRRWLRFLADRRALVSLIAVTIIFITSLFANLLANDRPYFVSYKGNAYFPFLVEYPESEFNGFAGPTNYYDPFIAEEINDNGFMLWPIVPYHYRRVVKDAGSEFPSPPDGKHWLGTDDKGRDVVARLIYGIRISFLFGFMYVFITATIGLSVGAMSGYFGGWLDLVLQRVLEIYGSLPTLFIIIAIMGVLQPNFWLLLFLLIAVWMDRVCWHHPHGIPQSAQLPVHHRRARLGRQQLSPSCGGTFSPTPWLARSPFCRLRWPDPSPCSADWTSSASACRRARHPWAR